MREMTECEVRSAICEEAFDLDGEVYEQEAEVEGDSGRWSQGVTTVFQRMSDHTFWSLEWYRGLTENQDHEFYAQVPQQVKRKEETRIVVSWVPC